MNYIDFLKTKIERAPISGFKISADEVHPVLKPHQRDAVAWAIEGGRRAIFASFGLGKTIMELEYCRLITKHKGGQALIVLPLGVKQEFTRDAVELLEMASPVYVTSMNDIRNAEGQIFMTNYERVRDGDIDPTHFMCTSLDEAAVLRSFGSKTYQTFLNKFKGIEYKLVSTATPSPNKYKELIHYAGYLEVMDTGQALTRFFQRDSQKANNLTLYPHKEDEFWLWMSTWSLFINKPSDLGYSDEGYDLPPMDVRLHVIPNDFTRRAVDKDGQIKFDMDAAVSLPDAAREKRESIDIRVRKMREIVDEAPTDHFILWHDLEAERHAIRKALPESKDIYGSMDYDIREKRVIDFSNGEIRLFATKKSLSGQGCNFQRHCHRAIFLGIDYEFNDFIQAIHRIYRFLQTEGVIIDIIYTESEKRIYQALWDKWQAHEYLQKKMREIIKKYGLSHSRSDEMTRKLGVKRVEIKGNHFTAVNDDCVNDIKTIESDSIGLIHTSIPFSNHYEYTPSYNDFGHSTGNDQFFEQMDYLTPELLRVLMPGRIAAIHVKDRVLFGNVTGTGMPTMDPFHIHCIEHYIKHRFLYIGMITIVTDVVRENNQTYRLGWSEQCKDGSKMGVGCPEYLLLFRKAPTDTSTAYADIPVVKDKKEYTRSRWQIDAHGFERSSGNRLLTKKELQGFSDDSLQKIYTKYSRENVYDYEDHLKVAAHLDRDGKLPATFMVVAPGSWSNHVWDDVNRMRTLNMDQKRKDKQMHVCPLQFDIVDRTINRYSNKGDIVYDPFGGIGTVPFRAMKLGRYGRMCELNPDYFRDAVGYLDAEELQLDMPTLFDLLESGNDVGEEVEGV